MVERCSRSGDVEALFDDRLPSEAAAILTSHIPGCSACSQAHAALREMRTALRETADAPNAFVLKRLRREMLERARAGSEVSRARPSFARLAAGLAAFAVVLASVIGFVVWFSRPAPLTTSVVVTAAPGALFSRESKGNFEIVHLTDGAFEFDVQEQPDGRRLLVMVPDGEIEDIGTRFRVVVKNAVTTEVSVSAGEVELRRNGAEPLRLIAGMTYRPIAAEAAASAAMAPTAQPTASPSVVARPGSASVAAHPPANRSSQPALQPSAPAPGGATAEDAAYMSVVRLLREGKQSEARVAAKQYLRDYPDGLRRAEMGAVSAQ